MLQMTMRRFLFLLQMLLLMVSATVAQTIVSSRQIDTASGLSNNFVLSMAFDGEGNLWVGTEAGLNRIAGQTVSVYRREQMGCNNDKILSLFYDAQQNRMLIGTELGLLVYDHQTSSFGIRLHGDSLVVYGLIDMADDHQQGVWLFYGNGKVQHLDCKTYEVSTLPLKLPGIRCGMDDGRGHLYIGHSKEGMSIVNLNAPTEVRRFTHSEETVQGGLPGNNVRRIMADRQGRIWVGTDCGLACFNPSTESFSTIRRQTFLDNVFDIRQLTDGRLWVATDVGGIITDDGSLVEVSSMNTRCLLEDSYQNVWVGNHSTGVSFIPHRKPFLSMLDYLDERRRPMRVYGVAADRQGRIWMSSENELSLWTSTDGLLHQEGHWPVTGMKHREHSFARCLMADSQGRVWMGMEDEGVICFDSRTQRFSSIDIGYDVCDIHSFFEDTDGRIWIGAEYGICVYDQGHVSHAEELDLLTKRAPVTSFIRTEPDHLLLTTQGNGLVVVNTRTGAAKTLMMSDGLPTNNISQAIADRDGSVWLATNEGLVHLPDLSDLTQFEVFGAKEGLSDPQVRAIRQDRQGRIWAGTYTTIAQFDTSDKRFRNYSQQDNINVGSFMEGTCAVAADGTIVFGSPSGAYFFHPAEAEASQQVSQVRIAMCEVLGATEDGNTTRLTAPNAADVITTSYQKNTLRIAYTVDDFAQIGDVEYSYKMSGLNDKWYFNGNDHDIMFRSLRPGRYTFVLRAKLRSQDWNEATSRQLFIVVTPPFWRTWWAYAFYLLLAVAVAVWLLQQYKRRIALRNSLEMTRRESLQKQELNEERLRFFTNITHELRTPLTLILGPLEDLTLDKQLSAHSRKKVELINKSAFRLRDLINEILEFRKTQTQNRRLTVARGDLGMFVKEIVLNYKELNPNPKVTISEDIANGLPPVYFDSEIITTVLSNLLSNASKYTPQGSITVSVKADDSGAMLISVADTGYGIAADALPHIFDRYYQAKGSHQASGTGIGLALVKALADLHEAQLFVESEEGKGSRFTLSLATDNTYPNALHKEDVEENATPLPSVTADGEQEGTEDLLEDVEETSPLLLIVEDNDDIRQYIADSLGEDYRILQAADGAEGVRMAKEHMPDIIVSDIMMPVMNGIELTRQLKGDICTSHIPIILLTAKDAEEDKLEGYDSGADSYLTKPFTAKLLESRIKNLLTSRRRLAERIAAAPPAATDLLTPSRTALPSVSTGREDAALSPLDRQFLERLNAVVEENIMQTDIDMAFLTDKMAMSHSTFYRKVKALTGLTAKEYVRKRKLRHSYQLLQTGDYNVTQAAMMTGFNQMTHFREVFKKEFGILPSEVKKNS